jgi:hypothetical protein
MIVGIPLVFAMLSEYFNDIIRRAETKALKQFGKNALHSYVRRLIVYFYICFDYIRSPTIVPHSIADTSRDQVHPDRHCDVFFLSYRRLIYVLCGR